MFLGEQELAQAMARQVLSNGRAARALTASVSSACARPLPASAPAATIAGKKTKELSSASITVSTAIDAQQQRATPSGRQASRDAARRQVGPQRRAEQRGQREHQAAEPELADDRAATGPTGACPSLATNPIARCRVTGLPDRIGQELLVLARCAR